MGSTKSKEEEIIVNNNNGQNTTVGQGTDIDSYFILKVSSIVIIINVILFLIYKYIQNKFKNAIQREVTRTNLNKI